MKVACTTIVATPRFRAVKLAERSNSDVDGAPLGAMRWPERHASAWLRQDAVDHAPGDVGETEVAALVTVSQPLMVDPQ